METCRFVVHLQNTSFFQCKLSSKLRTTTQKAQIDCAGELISDLDDPEISWGFWAEDLKVVTFDQPQNPIHIKGFDRH